MILELGFVVFALGLLIRLNTKTVPFSTTNTLMAIGVLLVGFSVVTELV